MSLCMILATSATSPTGRNLAATRTTRLALGELRDVVLVDGSVEVLALDELDAATTDRFVRRSGFDPRADASFRWFLVRPTQVQAWREADELAGRVLMRDGLWLH